MSTPTPSSTPVTARCIGDPTHHAHRYATSAWEIVEILPALSDLAGLERQHCCARCAAPGRSFTRLLPDGTSQHFASLAEATAAIAPGLNLPQAECRQGDGPEASPLGPDLWKAQARTLEMVWERELDDFRDTPADQNDDHPFWDLLTIYNALTGHDSLALDHVADHGKLPTQWPPARVLTRTAPPASCVAAHP